MANETQNANLETQLEIISDFAVLPNSTIVTLGAEELSNLTVGLFLAPNQAATLVYDGPLVPGVISMNGAAGGIIAGRPYVLAVIGDFGTSVFVTSIHPFYGGSNSNSG
jgi:hypothetical protein